MLRFAIVQGAVYDAVNAIDRGYRRTSCGRTRPRTRRKRQRRRGVVCSSISSRRGRGRCRRSTTRTSQSWPTSPGRGGGDRNRGGRSHGDARRRANNGQLGPPPTLVPVSAGRLGADLAVLANDPARRWGRSSRSRPERRHAPHGQDQRPHRCRLCGRVNEVKELGSLNGVTGRADESVFVLLAGPGAGLGAGSLAGWPPASTWASSTARAFSRALSGRGRRPDQLLERQILLAVLASDHGDPRGRHRRHPGNRGRPELAAAVRPAIPVFNPSPLFTPPLPDHPSGHGCATAAFTHTLKNFFGTDRSPSALSTTILYHAELHRFSDALEEVIYARVWAGIHFRTADEQGAKLQEGRPIPEEALLPARPTH